MQYSYFYAKNSTFAMLSQVFFETLQNKERERNALVSKS